MISIAVMGHGTVGSGVVEVLLKNTEIINKRVKNEIEVKHILDLREFNDLPYADKFTKDFNVILNDPDVKVVAEVMGGINPAYDFVKRCLLAGKSVVTSNKELVAAKGDELLRIAEENNVNFLFEASVGGTIPVIRPMHQCLAANEIVDINGILNGTTNFILTKMIKEGMTFEDALTLAQQLGYAEREPSADVDGHDACRKICILSALAFGKHVYPSQVYTEGIRKISAVDVAFASSSGYVVKLIGKARPNGNKIECMVCPMLINKADPLSMVDDVFNAIKVKGNMSDEVMFYGKGAGKLPTASAVVADIMDCVNHLNSRKYLSWDKGDEAYVLDHSEYLIPMYIRCKADNLEFAKQSIRNHFVDVEFLNCKESNQNEFAFITAKMQESKIIEKLDSISEITVLNTIRVLD